MRTDVISAAEWVMGTKFSAMRKVACDIEGAHRLTGAILQNLR